MIPESGEALDRNFAGAGDKLDEFGAFSVLVLLKDLPEPLNDWRLVRVLFVDYIFAQVSHIDGWQARDHQLELLVVEDANQVRWHEIVEALQECIDLRCNALVQEVLDDQLAVFKLVVVVDVDILTVRLELYVDPLIKHCRTPHEVLTKYSRVVLEHVLDGVVVLDVEVFQVTEVHGLCQHHLVNCAHEEAIEQLTLVQGLTNDSANKSEHTVHLFTFNDGGSGAWEVCSLLRLLEKCIVCIEDALTHELKPLAS